MTTNKLFLSIYIYRRTCPYLCSIIWLKINFSGVFELILKGISQFWNQSQKQCSFQRGHIGTVTCVSFIETLFYFIAILEICVYPIKQLNCVPNFYICHLIWWFFCGNRHSSFVCCSVTSRFYVFLVFVIKFVPVRFVFRAKLSALDWSS